MQLFNQLNGGMNEASPLAPLYAQQEQESIKGNKSFNSINQLIE